MHGELIILAIGAFLSFLLAIVKVVAGIAALTWLWVAVPLLISLALLGCIFFGFDFD